MLTAPQRVTLGRDRIIRLEVPAPDGLPEGELVAVVDLEPAKAEDKPKNRLTEICGKGRGKFWMADDFDAPLEEFAEYM